MRHHGILHGYAVILIAGGFGLCTGFSAAIPGEVTAGILRPAASSGATAQWRFGAVSETTTEFEVRIPTNALSWVETAEGQGLRMLADGIPARAGTPDIPSVSCVIPIPSGFRASLAEAPTISSVTVPARLRQVPGSVAAVRPGAEADVSAGWVRLARGAMGPARYLRMEVPIGRWDPAHSVVEVLLSLRGRLVYAPQEAERCVAASSGSEPSAKASASAAAAGQAVTTWPGPLLPPVEGLSTDFAPRRSGAAAEAYVRIQVGTATLCRVSAATLLAAGVESNQLVGSRLRLFCHTQEVAIAVSTAGLMQPGDGFVFWGLPFQGAISDTNVYWLGFGEGGRRIGSRSVEPVAGAQVVTSFTATVTGPEKLLYRSFYRPDDATFDHWFAALLTGTETALPLRTDRPVRGGAARLRLVLDGLSSDAGVSPDHRTQVRVNGTVLTNLLGDGQATYPGEVPFAGSLLSNGISVVRLQQTQAGVADDSVYLRDLQLDYERELAGAPGGFMFGGQAGSNTYTVSGFTVTGAVRFLDVTDPAAAVELVGGAWVSNAAGWQFRATDISGESRQYWLGAATGAMDVATVECVRFRGLADVGMGADIVVICPADLRLGAYTLLKHRATQGMQVAVAPLADIYNEFGYGIADPDAIRQFIGFAYHHWQKAPAHVCLVGNGTYDLRGRLGPRPPAGMPVHMGPSAYAWTAEDAWFAQVERADTLDSNDTLPDVALGRITVTNDAQLVAVVDKIRQYEAITNNPDWQTRALLVADNYDAAADLDFKAASEQYLFSALTNSGYTVAKAYLDDTANPRTIIRDRINAGRYLVTYIGHGWTNVWAEENIWNTSDTLALTNTVYPVVSMFTCGNGYFQDPGTACLAETFLGRPGRGAVACLAPSAFSVELYAGRIADGFAKSLIRDRTPRLGEAWKAALLNLWTFNPDVSELMTYTLFGDPALRVHGSP